MWRCRRSVTWKHEKTHSVQRNSIFDNSHFDMREVLVFIREWLLHLSLHRCSIEAGMDYNNTSIDWANFMRDLCHKFVHDLYYGGEEIFRGKVEIDDSLFGRKCKFHCGDP